MLLRSCRLAPWLRSVALALFAWSGAGSPCPRANEDLRSRNGGEAATATVYNRAGVELLVRWLDTDGEETDLGVLADSTSREDNTYIGHAFRFHSADNPRIVVKEFVVKQQGQKVNIGPCDQLKGPKRTRNTDRDEEFKSLVHDQFSPCGPAGQSEQWSCIRRTKKADLSKRNKTLWGFATKKEAQGRGVGQTEDHGYVHHIPKMPRVTNGPGYLKMNMTQALKDLIIPFYHKKKKDSVGDEGVIGGGYTNNHVFMTKHLNLDNHRGVHSRVIKEMKQVLQWWTKQELKNSGTFGIRIYPRHAMLINHVDRSDSHIASAVLQVAQEVDEDGGWPLEVINANGDCAEVFLQAGEMVLYEGGRFKHGRPMRFRGDSFANIFAHFAPITWSGPGVSPSFKEEPADVSEFHRNDEL